MEPIYKSLQDYIKSGEYFADAKEWYKYKYIHPFSQRSFILILSAVICALFIGVVININSLFPSVIQVKYSITADTSANKSAQITRANQIENSPLASIIDVLIRNYVLKRESYNYDNLKKQFVYIKNNSTRIVFRRFYNYMNIDNPSSPIMRYQKGAKRKITIISAQYPSPNKALIEFNSIAENAANEVIEDAIWQATIDLEVDDINTNLPSGARFNFTIIDYQLKLLKDKKTNKS
ncbi:MAG: VirB8/TrbF family protein [Rickettsiaceae bacterium]|jgi:type IV secretion system protein VirB8|nr:VirB8/TrbF family protein [Rickettsiaceae bacterium]